MAYTLEEFCDDYHTALKKAPCAGGYEEIRAHLEMLLENEDFVKEYLSGQGSGKTTRPEVGIGNRANQSLKPCLGNFQHPPYSVQE